MPTAAKLPKPSIPKVVVHPSFFELQSRRRTEAKGWAILTGALGGLMTWTFCFVILAALVFYANFLSLLLPHQVTRVYAFVMDYAGGPFGIAAAAVLFTAGLAWVAHRIFFRDTSAALIWRVGARRVESEDPTEQQFVHEVEQLTIAAGAPLPAILFFDGPVVNAAVIGDRAEAAGILVSRELLNRLDPDERQGVVAHLLASSINGDLRLTGTMLRIFYMMGFLLTLLDLPFSPGARKTIALVWRYARQSDRKSAAALGEEVGPALTRCLQPDGLDSLTIIARRLIGEETDLRSLGSTVLLVPLFPFFVLRVAAGVTYSLISMFLGSPWVALVWRARRHRADATAVELTHNPDGLARALIHLYGSAHAVAQAGWSEMAFVVGLESGNVRPFERWQKRVAEVTATANNFNHRLRQQAPLGSGLTSLAQGAGAAASHDFVFGFHPPLGTRILRLKKRGSRVAWSEPADHSSWMIVGVLAGVVGTGLLVLLA